MNLILIIKSVHMEKIQIWKCAVNVLKNIVCHIIFAVWTFAERKNIAKGVKMGFIRKTVGTANTKLNMKVSVVMRTVTRQRILPTGDFAAIGMRIRSKYGNMERFGKYRTWADGRKA